jgi:hypothetical protein
VRCCRPRSGFCDHASCRQGSHGKGDGCKKVHREIVLWLRREWTIGRIERVGGVWNYVQPASAA